MSDLIEALQIFLKYENPPNPFHCEHDTLYIYVVHPDEVSREDKTRLNELGFFPEEEYFISYRFGSC